MPWGRDARRPGGPAAAGRRPRLPTEAFDMFIMITITITIRSTISS